MTIKNFALENVLPNPFQTRDREDPEHIAQLVKSIREVGWLLQNPVGRLTSPLQPVPFGKAVELAFGHNRLAAFKELVKEDKKFAELPVDIRELTNQQMFELAVRENRDRKDLNPIEEARAMQTYRDEFKKTTKEIGDLFQITDSAVRNKIRLLGLPEDIQAAMGERKISEGTAREILVVQDLPEKLISRYSYQNDATQKSIMKQVIKDALKGESTENIRAAIDNTIERRSEELSKATWKWDDILEGKGIVGICTGCRFKLERGKKSVCLNWPCYQAKEITKEIEVLTAASQKSGIQPLSVEERENFGSDCDHSFGYSKSVFPKIKKSGCENLRLIIEKRAWNNPDEDPQYLTKDVKIVCLKKKQFCTCLKALSSGVKIGESVEQSKESLKEMNRRVREKQKFNKEFCTGMVEETKKRIREALKQPTVHTWMLILKNTNYGNYYKFNSIGKEKITEKQDEIMENLIGAWIHDIQYWPSEPARMRDYLNDQLAIAGLPKLKVELPRAKDEDVSAETGENPVSPAIQSGMAQQDSQAPKTSLAGREVKA